jgi:hypothetical protein
MGRDASSAHFLDGLSHRAVLSQGRTPPSTGRPRASIPRSSAIAGVKPTEQRTTIFRVGLVAAAIGSVLAPFWLYGFFTDSGLAVL